MIINNVTLLFEQNDPTAGIYRFKLEVELREADILKVNEKIRELLETFGPVKPKIII